MRKPGRFISASRETRVPRLSTGRERTRTTDLPNTPRLSELRGRQGTGEAVWTTGGAGNTEPPYRPRKALRPTAHLTESGTPHPASRRRSYRRRPPRHRTSSARRAAGPDRSPPPAPPQREKADRRKRQARRGRAQPRRRPGGGKRRAIGASRRAASHPGPETADPPASGPAWSPSSTSPSSRCCDDRLNPATNLTVPIPSVGPGFPGP